MMKYSVKCWAALLLAAVQASVCAQSCNAYQRDKMEYITQKVSKKVAQYNDGINQISAKMTSCDWNSYSGVYTVKMETYWYGWLFTDKQYNEDGTFTIDGNDNFRYETTYRNQNLRDYRQMKHLGEALLILTELSSR